LWYSIAMIDFNIIKNLIKIDLHKSFKNKKDKSSLLIAGRFIKIFEYHGISKDQIPEIFPDISLSDLTSKEDILAMLNEDLLKKTASLFCINKEWLQGETKKIYRGLGCYKRPEVFFDKLKDIDFEETFRPVLVFSVSRKLDFKSGKNQPIVLFLQEKITTIGTKDIYRYFLFSDGWNWRNYNGRIQLKAMGKIVWDKFEIDVPIYSISKKNFRKLQKGEAVPSEYNIEREDTGLFLENYALSLGSGKDMNNLPPGERIESKEREDVSVVEKYCESIIYKNN
jgi:hypothetical protein